MPIYKLADEMPYEELMGWLNYLERRPIDWRDDDRTAKLLSAQGVKEKPQNMFPSLQAVYSRPPVKEGTLDVNSLKKSMLFSKMLSAKGGDKVLND